MQAAAHSKGWFWAGEEPEWLVVLMVVVALALGWVLIAAVGGQTRSSTVGGLTLRYPADWIQDADLAGMEGMSLYAGGLSGSQPSVAAGVLRELDPNAPVSLDELVAQRGFAQAQSREMYRVLTSQRARVGSESGVALTYGYVRDAASSPHLSALPVVIMGVDYIVPHSGKVYVISLEAAATEFEAQRSTFGRILRSVRFQ
jgi:hypothetical protein